MTQMANRRRDEQGQSLVELALLLPVLLLVFVGIIEFGWVFMGYLDMLHASREGIRYASVHAYDDTDVLNRIQSATNRFTAVEQSDLTAFNNGSPPRGTMWVYFDVPVRSPGQTYTIRVKAGIGLLTSLLEPVIGSDEITASTVALMRIE